MSKRKYNIKADGNKETTDLKKIKSNVDDDYAKIKIKHNDGSLKNEKQKADDNVIILGQQNMHP